MKPKRNAVSSARLACGCVLGFREGQTAGSPVTVVVTAKGSACALSIHVSGVPVYDHREALRPATRPLPPLHTDFEEEN
ncbi:MAG: hypothetical protein KA205_01535 [Acidobacteria bacterium]|nr:hypothetical protein [Acidobacteriota bacterium]